MSETPQSENEDWFHELREGIAESETQGENEVDGSNKGGRPPKPESEKKTERFTVWCTETQQAEIERKADEVGLSAASFIRSAVLNKEVEGKVNAETRRELRRIGANLKQLAKVVNAAGEIEEAEQLDLVLDAVNKAARSIQ